MSLYNIRIKKFDSSSCAVLVGSSRSCRLCLSRDGFESVQATEDVGRADCPRVSFV